MSTDAICVSVVSSRSDRKQFIELPYGIYSGDPHWVPPLRRDIMGFLKKETHPFRNSGDIEFFLARSGGPSGPVCGRIAAIQNHAHEAKHQDGTGFFGFFECTEQQSVAGALLDTAAAWLRERGLKTMRGPVSPSMNYECGLRLFGGIDQPGPPYLMMPHNPPRYAQHLEDYGFAKAMDLQGWYLNQDETDSTRWIRFGERIMNKSGVTLRHLDMSRFTEEVRLVIDLFNDAWSENWGFVPLNAEEVEHMAKELKPIIRPRFCSFLMRDGEAVGVWLGLPDYNRVLINLKGRLFPFGIFKLLRAKKKLTGIRVMLMGIRKAHQHRGLDAALYADIMKGSQALGVFEAEAGWILETNYAMSNTLSKVGSKPFRAYRLYDKPL